MALAFFVKDYPRCGFSCFGNVLTSLIRRLLYCCWFVLLPCPPRTNAGILTNVFKGGDNATGPIADTIALNAGAGLYVMGTVGSIKEGVDHVREVMRSGKCWELMQQWSQTTQTLSKNTE